MALLRTIWAEFAGLFVDDWTFAAAIAIWLLVCWLALPRLPVPGAVAPVILLAGLVGILVESAFRRARAG